MQQAMDALLVADIAVICVSPNPDHAVLAAPFIRLAEQAKVPAVLFINRVDEARAPARDIVAALQGYSRHPLVLRQMPIRDGGRIVGAVDLVSERAWKYRDGEQSELIEIPAGMLDDEHERRGELLESLSEYDDWLLEELIEDRSPATGAVYGICGRVLAGAEIVEAFIGSAEHRNGISRLMKALRHEAPAIDVLTARLDPDGRGGAQAASFLARHRKHVGKTIYLRALAELKTGDGLGGGALGPLGVVRGDKFEQVQAVAPGQIFSAIKSDHLEGGRLYAAGELPAPDWYRPLPALLRSRHRPGAREGRRKAFRGDRQDRPRGPVADGRARQRVRRARSGRAGRAASAPGARDHRRGIRRRDGGEAGHAAAARDDHQAGRRALPPQEAVGRRRPVRRRQAEGRPGGARRGVPVRPDDPRRQRAEKLHPGGRGGREGRHRPGAARAFPSSTSR